MISSKSPLQQLEDLMKSIHHLERRKRQPSQPERGANRHAVQFLSAWYGCMPRVDPVCEPPDAIHVGA